MYEGWVGWFGGACLQLSLLLVVVVVVVLTGALQAVFVSVRAYNLAGLHTTVLASGLAVDTTPPQRGFVHDGEHNVTGGRDVDYQVRVRCVRVCVRACWCVFRLHAQCAVNLHAAVRLAAARHGPHAHGPACADR
jgi:hypothetical protein